MKEKRDVYVLSQLFDHGFDSLTGILNVFILSKIFLLDFTFQRIIFIVINGTFLISTYYYRINKNMVFGIQNNPTESVIFTILLILFSEYINDLFLKISIILLTIFAIYLNSIDMYKLYFIDTKNKREKIELIEIILFIILFIVKCKNNTDLIVFMILIHILEINLILCEIFGNSCEIQNGICLILTIFLPNTTLLIILFGLYSIYLWYDGSKEICNSLKMNNPFEIPAINNNPYCS
jgi:hypothetical protein